jgi:hypothetical protein
MDVLRSGEGKLRGHFVTNREINSIGESKERKTTRQRK